MKVHLFWILGQRVCNISEESPCHFILVLPNRDTV